MIGKLSGRIDHKGLDHVLIDVGGVGYVVHVSDRTRAALPAAGGFAALYTELLVREDLLQLFGFLTVAEREWHRLLTSVQGVGAKSGMAILGTLGADGVSRAIALGDWSSIKAAPGIGPKIAQRIVNELKEKAPALMAMGGGAPKAETAVIEDDAAPAARGTGPALTPPAATGQADAMSALSNLGYAPGEAAAAVAQAAGEGATEASALIRAALKLLAPKG